MRLGSIPISLETGMHSPRVSRLLSELGHEVIVAHARNVRLIGESRKKDDRIDAQTLARIDPQPLVRSRLVEDKTSGMQSVGWARLFEGKLFQGPATGTLARWLVKLLLFDYHSRICQSVTNTWSYVPTAMRARNS